MAKQQSSAAAARVRKKVKKNVAEGIAHVHASFNNTIITITAVNQIDPTTAELVTSTMARDTTSP
jgi:ribosomal protein S11